MKLGKFWMVTKPKPLSELADICFEIDAKGLALQFKGGLDPEDIHAVYTERGEAEKDARRVLAAFKKYDAALREGSR